MLDKCREREYYMNKYSIENEDILTVRRILFCQSNLNKSLHNINNSKISSLTSQLTSACIKLEQANKSIEYLLSTKDREKEALVNAINNQLEKARIDLECANNYVNCTQKATIKSRCAFEYSIKVMLSEHEQVLKILRQKFEDTKMEVHFLINLKKDQEIILEELKRDREILHEKLMEFEQNNYAAFKNLKSLINEKEGLVQKICARELSVEKIQKKYSKILDKNFDLQSNLDSMKSCMGIIMQKELEKCDIDVLLMLVEFVTKMCQAQDILVETEHEMNTLRSVF